MAPLKVPIAGLDFATDKSAVCFLGPSGERTGGHANAATGEIGLGYGFSALIPNAQPKSPITHTNWEGVGVEPDVVTNPNDALLSAYKTALKDARSSVESGTLLHERETAIQDPQSALAGESAEFHMMK